MAGQTPDVREVVSGDSGLAVPNFFSLAVDPAGNIFVGGANSSNVLRVAPRGDRAGAAGDGPCVAEIFSQTRALELQFNFAGPKGLAIASNGDVYVAGTGGSAGGPGPGTVKDNVVRISPDATVLELFNRDDVGLDDLNPSGLALDEAGGDGPYVYVAGPAPAGGHVVRIAPDLTSQIVLTPGGQGVVVDEVTGDVYVAQPGRGVTRIPDAKAGVCSPVEKPCPVFIEAGDNDGCSGKTVTLNSAYALALAGGVLYVTGQNSNNVLRRPIREDNMLGLPDCVEEIFADGDAGITFNKPRAIAADADGNVYAAADRSDNVVWIKPDQTGLGVSAQQILSRDTPNVTFAGPPAVAVDSEGNLYAAGGLTNNVFRIRTVNAGLACGNGVRDANETCEYRLDCCCSVACELQGAGAGCRGSAAECDVADRCSGVDAACADERRDASTVCRAAAGSCDVEERCEGDVACPQDEFTTAGVACRAAVDRCDVAESCTGTGPACPVDALAARGTECRPSVDSCDIVERCDGTSTSCPPDFDCTRCSRDDDCIARDVCVATTCQANRCVETPKAGFALATCAFLDPFPGDEFSTDPTQQCVLAAAADSVCGASDRKKNAKVICKLRKKEQSARAQLENACSLDAKQRDRTVRRILGAFNGAILRVGKIPPGRITADCRTALTRRFGDLRENLNAAVGGGLCPQ